MEFIENHFTNIHSRRSRLNNPYIYLRNFIRNEILAKLKEQFPESYAGIRQSYAALTDDACFLDFYTSKIDTIIRGACLVVL